MPAQVSVRDLWQAQALLQRENASLAVALAPSPPCTALQELDWAAALSWCCIVLLVLHDRTGQRHGKILHLHGFKTRAWAPASSWCHGHSVYRALCAVVTLPTLWSSGCRRHACSCWAPSQLRRAAVRNHAARRVRKAHDIAMAVVRHAILLYSEVRGCSAPNAHSAQGAACTQSGVGARARIAGHEFAHATGAAAAAPGP